VVGGWCFILLSGYNSNKIMETNKEEYEPTEKGESLLEVTPFPCIYCTSPHIKILGVFPNGTLACLCEECNKIFVLYDKSGKKIKLNKKKKKSPTYTG